MASREMRVSVTDIPEVVVMIADLTAERDEARAAVERVRELHSPEDRGHGVCCKGCSTAVTFMFWPCATIRALDGAP